MALSSRRSARPRFTLLLLVLTAVTLLTVDQRSRGAGALDSVKDGARDGFAPVQRATDRLLAPVGSFVGGIVHHGQAEAENERLRRELASLQGRVAAAADAERERRLLLQQLRLDFVGDIPRVGARVVSASPSNFEQTVVISKGRRDGVAEGMPVVTAGGLVGRVTATTRTQSTVMLLSDRQSSVGVRLSVSGDVGVANGRGVGRPLTVDLIDPSTKIEPREMLVTSGLQQSQFPPGIPVGTVETASVRPNALQQTVTMRPAADLERLTFVQVLQWSAEASPPPPTTTTTPAPPSSPAP